MGQFRYILQPYNGIKTKYQCPKCDKKGVFVRYIDITTNEHLSPIVGRCDREINCGYHYKPKQYFYDNKIDSKSIRHSEPIQLNRVIKSPKASSYVSSEIFKQSLRNYEENNFIKFLVRLFDIQITNQLIAQYFIATSKHWNGATVFWQIDSLGKIRSGKIMLYNSETGKRIKEPFPHITWVHKALNYNDFNLEQCLFGEHLLKNDQIKPVALVESEKTAVLASVYLPQFIWLAIGGMYNLNVEKCRILKGRTVVLFPDLNGFNKWESKVKGLSHLGKFIISDLLEKKAFDNEKQQGLDLADYLLKFNYKDFRLS